MSARKIFFATLLIMVSAEIGRAQIPVVDASNLAQLIAMVRKVQDQINLAKSQLEVIRNVRSLSDQQLQTLAQQLAFQRFQAQGFVGGTLPQAAANMILMNIRQAIYRQTGVVPVSQQEVAGYYHTIRALLAAGDVAGVLETANLARERIRESTEAVMAALEHHEAQLNESAAQLDMLDAMAEGETTAQQQRQLQTKAATITARETMLLREAINWQSYLMMLQYQEQQSYMAEQDAVQRKLLGPQRTNNDHQ